EIIASWNHSFSTYCLCAVHEHFLFPLFSSNIGVPNFVSISSLLHDKVQISDFNRGLDGNLVACSWTYFGRSPSDSSNCSRRSSAKILSQRPWHYKPAQSRNAYGIFPRNHSGGIYRY